MSILKKIFYLFVILSILFLAAGLYSGYTLALIAHQRTEILTNNPKDVQFSIFYNKTSYAFGIKLDILNSGPFAMNIHQITWHVYLVNGSMKYQANNYQRYYSPDERLTIPAGKSLTIYVIDNQTTLQWAGNILPHLRWMVQKYGMQNITWHNTIDIVSFLGNFNTEEYRYNVRTWYLWTLPEVLIEYEKDFRVS